MWTGENDTKTIQCGGKSFWTDAEQNSSVFVWKRIKVDRGPSVFREPKPIETLRSREKKLTVSHGTSHWVFCYTSQLINLPRFQGARPDHVRVQSSCCCFPRELVSFARPRELVSFVRPRELVSFVRPWELVSFVRPRELVSFVRPRELVSFVRP